MRKFKIMFVTYKAFEQDMSHTSIAHMIGSRRRFQDEAYNWAWSSVLIRERA